MYHHTICNITYRSHKSLQINWNIIYSLTAFITGHCYFSEQEWGGQFSAHYIDHNGRGPTGNDCLWYRHPATYQKPQTGSTWRHSALVRWQCWSITYVCKNWYFLNVLTLQVQDADITPNHPKAYQLCIQRISRPKNCSSHVTGLICAWAHVILGLHQGRWFQTKFSER